MITQTTTKDGQSVQIQVPNPELEYNEDWGWVHHGSGNRWHTLAGTNLEKADGKLSAANDGPPGVAGIQAIDLTR